MAGNSRRTLSQPVWRRSWIQRYDTVAGNPRHTLSSRYGADATLGRIGHSVALSRRPAEIAGVVEALMGHDTLFGRSVEAGGDGLRATRPRATRRMRPRARRRSGSLPRPCARRLARYGECTPAEAFPGEPRARRRRRPLPRLGAPCRGLPWGASREAEFVPRPPARGSRRGGGGLGRGR